VFNWKTKTAIGHELSYFGTIMKTNKPFCQNFGRPHQNDPFACLFSFFCEEKTSRKKQKS
jgi:hypothetical protein